MTIQTKKYVRKRFEIEAIRITHENMAEVAAWCQGEIRHIKDPSTDEVKDIYIKVNVHHALSDSQTKGFIGHWVLYAGTGFKVYKHKAFLTNFLPVNDDGTDPVETRNVFDTAAIDI